MTDAPTSEAAPLVSVERHADGVAVVTLQHGKVNAISAELLRQLRGVVAALADDLPGAVVVTGGERILRGRRRHHRVRRPPDEARRSVACSSPPSTRRRCPGR
ncbi:MAG: hypothetical protein U0P45_00050 [Acidimicrobiales bacterium]